MKLVTVNVTEQEFTYLLNTLAQRPYGEVFQLIVKLQAQAAAAGPKE